MNRKSLNEILFDNDFNRTNIRDPYVVYFQLNELIPSLQKKTSILHLQILKLSFLLILKREKN